MDRKLLAHRWIFLLALALTVFLLAAVSWASDGEIARVGATQGDAKIQRAGEAQYKKLDKNAPLYLMDFLATGRGAKIWWKGAEGAWSPYSEVTHGSLGENTVFGFAGFQKIGTATKFVGKVNKGIVRFIKRLPMTDPPSTFSIATPTAWIDVAATERAADFVVETIEESRTTITVIWGKVRVRNIMDQAKEERILTSCQEVDVEKDREPSEIRWVSSDTMKNLIKRTTIPDTLPTDVPSCERLKTEVIHRPGAVYVAPPGIVVVPVPVPTPPPKGCPCPPGSYVDPATNQCACCPPGRLYSADKCDCGCPCPPNYEYDPQYQRCVPCREGSGYNADSCRCACPCPQGQVLLPGTGCVSECPRGFTVSYDTSEGLPRRCPVCVQQPVPETPLPPPCTSDTQCRRCENCVQGNCVPKTCPQLRVLNTRDCTCVPLNGDQPPPCQEGQCPACQRCQDGQCVPTVTCSQRQRLNLETCQCEDMPTVLLTPPTGEPGCTSNSDCGEGQVCRKGKCVKKPPVTRRRTPSEEQTSTESTGVGDLGGTTTEVPTFTRPGFGIGIGGGGGGQRVPTPRTPIRGKPN